MKIAIIGSRNLTIENLEEYIPEETTEIVSGGARGIDTCAGEYAEKNGIPLTVFLPDYRRYRGGATFCRNGEIVKYADCVLAFWDGKSKGTEHVIRLCEKFNKKIRVVLLKN